MNRHIKIFYNNFTDRYSRTIIHPIFIKKRLTYRAIDEAKRYARGMLIDVGCGRMQYREELEPLVKKYIGVDHPKLSKLYRSPRNPDVIANAENLPFADKTFDVALLLEVLEYVVTPATVLQEIGRVLKPKGFLILSSPFLYSIHDDPFDRARYTDRALVDLLTGASFRILKVEKLGGFLEFWILSLLVFLWKRIKDLLTQPMHFTSILLFPILILIAVPLTLVGNSIVFILEPILSHMPKYPNNFPLDILIVARKNA